jgi:hypothetical protein
LSAKRALLESHSALDTCVCACLFTAPQRESGVVRRLESRGASTCVLAAITLSQAEPHADRVLLSGVSLDTAPDVRAHLEMLERVGHEGVMQVGERHRRRRAIGQRALHCAAAHRLDAAHHEVPVLHNTADTCMPDSALVSILNIQEACPHRRILPMPALAWRADALDFCIPSPCQHARPTCDARQQNDSVTRQSAIQ